MHLYHMFLERLSTEYFRALISTLGFLNGVVRHNLCAFLENLVAKLTGDLEIDSPCELPRKRCTSRLRCYSTIYSPTHLPVDSFKRRAYFKQVKRLKKMTALKDSI